MSRSKDEAREQGAFFEWVRLMECHDERFKQFFHPPNGGSRNVIEAVALKRQGVRKGVSDVILLVPSSGFHGLVIEMKKPIKKGESKPVVSHEQQEFIERCRKFNYMAEVAYSCEEAVAITKNYLKII